MVVDLYAGIAVDVAAQITERGIEPSKRETYANGVSKITYHDPEGNEIGFGGLPG